TASRQMKRLEQPAMRLLEKLLPEMGTNIKGIPCDKQSLMHATSTESEAELDELLRALDHGLKIITKTESNDSNNKSTDTTYYQLTHDFLVSPIRRWIRSQKSSTWRGRSALRIEELATNFQRENDNRFLPGPLEFASAALATRSVDISASARRLINKAWLHYGKRFAFGSIVFLTALSAFWWFAERQANNVAASEANRILQVAPTAHLPLIQAVKTKSNVSRVARCLRNLSTTDTEAKRRMAISLALLEGLPKEERLPRILEQLENAPSATVDAMIEALAKSQTAGDNILERYDATENLTARSRLAILLAYTGDFQLLKRALQPGPDPSLRTITIHELKEWHGDLVVLKSQLQVDDPGLQSGVCLALGSMGPITDSETLQLFRMLAKNDSALVSGSAEWALRKSGQTVVRQKTDGKEWFWQKDGIKFIQIPANLFTESNKKTFYLSDREVSRTLFRIFVAETKATWNEGDEYAANPEDVPPTQVSYSMATSFCNWLSSRDGRQAYYDEDNSPIPSSNGYRLATTEECEAASRGGATTNNSFGTNKLLRFASAYEAFSANCEVGGVWRLRPRGSLMPNNIGLFDMMGNTKEWAEYAEDDFVPEYRPTWGLTFRSPLHGMSLSYSDRSLRNYNGAISFRVACDQRPQSAVGGN
ncbi:MAG: SUMF1/EgtB/PvdO family nonheme iron enzyme, partial [Planctomycetota bacterium]